MTVKNKKCCSAFSRIIKPLKENLLRAEEKKNFELFDQVFNLQKIFFYQ